MNKLINFDDVNNRIITIRNQAVLLDSDVAMLYGVETKRVNEAVKNNPKKFPEGYVINLKVNELDTLKQIAENPKLSDNQLAVEIFDRQLTVSNLSRVLPTAFTEKGLYMLATILKSDRAIDATIAIVETFAKLRELSRNIAMLSTMEPEVIEPEIIEKTGGLFNDLLFEHFPTTSAETSLEFNIGVMKGKRIIKSENTTIMQNMQNKINDLVQTITKLNDRLDKLEK